MEIKQVLVIRPNRGAKLDSLHAKVAELGPEKVIKYSDDFVETADTVYHYHAINSDLNLSILALFKIVDAGPLFKQLSDLTKQLSEKELIDTSPQPVAMEENVEVNVEKTVSGTEIDGKYSGKEAGKAPESPESDDKSKDELDIKKDSKSTK